MENLKRIGKSDLYSSRLILGSWAIGGWMWGGTDEKEAIYTIDTALNNGINTIDTAPMYGFGKSEEIIGKAIKGKRDKVIIANKCGLVWNTTNGAPAFRTNEDSVDMKNGKYLVRRYLDPNSIVDELEKSLKRLNTDYIDLYQTHWQEDITPLDDVMEVLLRMKEQGKIRAIGVSNATVQNIMDYRALGEIDSNQEQFSMIDRKNETSNLAYCRRHKLGFLAYSPLSFGMLTGRFSEDDIFDSNDIRSTKNRFSGSSIKIVNDMLSELACFREKYNLSHAAFALAWALNFDGCTHVLGGSRKSKHVLDNITSMGVVIESEDMLRIEKIIKKYLHLLPKK